MDTPCHVRRCSPTPTAATAQNMYDIADALTQLGFDVSARLVGQVLADYGLSKKNG